MNYSENMLPAASSQSRATYMAARQKPREMAKAAPLSLAAAHSAVTTLAPMTSRATMHSALKWQRRAPGISRSISVFVTIRLKCFKFVAAGGLEPPTLWLYPLSYAASTWTFTKGFVILWCQT